MAIGWGNFGALPQPPCRASNPASRASTAAPRSSRVDRDLAVGQANGARDVGGQARGGRLHLRASLAPRARNPLENVEEGRHAVPAGVREVRAAVERSAVRREEDRHRPATRAGHRLHRVHVDGVEIGALLAVHLDRHEVLIQEGGGRRVLEGLALHHVAPVAGRVPDREEDRPVQGARALQRLRSPGVPVDRVVGVLQQVRARLAGEPVGAHGTDPTLPARGRRQRRRCPAAAVSAPADCQRRLRALCQRTKLWKVRVAIYKEGVDNHAAGG